MPEDAKHQSESITLPPETWAKLDRVVEKIGAIIGPRNRPSWRVMLREIAEGSIEVRRVRARK